MNKTHPTMQRVFDATGDGASDIARAVNTSPQNINNWSKRGISKKGAIDIAKNYDLSVDWILTGEGEMKTTPFAVQNILENAPRAYVATAEDKANRVLVKLYDVKACCGDGSEIFEFEPLKKELPFDHSFFSHRGLKSENCIMLYAKNDSMEYYICDGDTVMIDKSKIEAKDGEVYAVWFAGELMLKRIFKESADKLILSSDNKKYRDREVTINNGVDFRILGQVIYRSG